MYYNIAKKVIEPMMVDNHGVVAENCRQTQSLLNKQANLGIVGQKPELNNDRIQGIVQRIADEDNFDDIKWILDEPIVNFSQSIVDDSIKSNADLHYKAGLSPKIVRTANAGCCEWCSKMVGSFDYPSGLPPDVFRRHGHCRCEVHYHPGDGKKQNVWDKKWNREDEADKIKKRISFSKSHNISKVSNYIVRDYLTRKDVKDMINKEKQLRHLEKTRDEGRSYMYGDLVTSQLKYHRLKGTGIPIMSIKGWTNKERVADNQPLGVYQDENGTKYESRHGIIIYSKSGSHIYPTKEE